jgi:hypothetical protein
MKRPPERLCLAAFLLPYHGRKPLQFSSCVKWINHG